MSDVYDCKAWRLRFDRSQDGKIVLLICVDAIPAFKNLGMSLMPAEVIILSLPPQFRTRPEFMLLSMLIPANLKPASQKKYFDYLCAELNSLATDGLQDGLGETRHVLFFGSSLDLPGRDKFLGFRGS